MSSDVKKPKKLNVIPYLFILPHLIMFIMFFAYPLVYGVAASFTKWNLYTDPVFIGLDNYKMILFNKDSTFYFQFWNGLKHTFIFVILCVPFQILLPLLIATALNTKPKGFAVFQSIFYMPSLFSITAVILTWMFIFDRTLGLFNNIVGTDINWYREHPYAWTVIIIVTLWWIIGGNLIIYVAALSGVDKSVLESADIDGANSVKKFIHILLPTIRFPLIYTLIISIIQGFNIYGQPLMLTEGKPGESTFVLLMYIRNLAFGTGNPAAGVATAMSTALGVVVCSISIFQLILLRNKD